MTTECGLCPKCGSCNTDWEPDDENRCGCGDCGHSWEDDWGNDQSVRRNIDEIRERLSDPIKHYGLMGDSIINDAQTLLAEVERLQDVLRELKR
jgi:hypothetical protein